MPAPIRVVHKTRPQDDIMDDVGHVIKGLHPMAYQVLLVMYERGKQKGSGDVVTEGGIIVPTGAQTRVGEDHWQGKVGLIVAIGPHAFSEGPSHKWGDRVPKVGDWVMISIGDAYSFDLPGDRRARQVHEADVKLIVDDETIQAVW